jgi:two-component system sensor histidine kinase HydH
VILITGQGSEQIAVEAMRRGASDYIVKSGTGGEIVPAVVEQVIERDHMRRRNEQLEAEHVRFARLAAIGEVAAGIAHEIRNPMTVISGMASLMRDNFDRLPPDQLRECARAIADNCSHLNRVLDEVLTSPQSSGERGPMLLSDLIDETLSFMRFDRAFRNHVMISRDYRARGLVYANRDELKQVFINLSRNAAQAIQMANKLHGTLCISVEEDTVADTIIVNVQDNGLGIAPEVYPQLFETGFTTKTSGNVRGTGLGLGICRRIMQAHGGTLTAVEPTPGEGATFRLTLPAYHGPNSH